MRNAILATALMAAASTTAYAQERIIVQPQDTVRERVIVQPGVPTDAPISVLGPDGRVITEVDRPRFRQYIVQERVPSYAVEGPVTVGTVLPETGVTYYEVPQQYGATNYRYSVVNDRPILVEPRTRRVIQVLE